MRVQHRDDDYPPITWGAALIVILIIAVLIISLLIGVINTYAQNTTVGGAFAAGGKPSAAIVVGAPSCATTATGSPQTSLAVNAASAGNQRLLLAVLHYGGAASVLSVGNGTQSFTSAGAATAETVRFDFWKLTAPVLGNQTITAAFSQAVNASLCVLSAENINQPTSVQGFTSTNGLSGPVNLSRSSSVGNVLISAFVSANNFITDYDGSYVYEAQPGASVLAFIGQKPGASTVTFTYPLTNSNGWQAGTIEIVKAP